MEKTIRQILIEKLTKEKLMNFCKAWDNGTLDEIIDKELCPKDAENYPEKYVNADNEAKASKTISKFYKHDLKRSRRESNKRMQKAKAQRGIPILAEDQILHLIDIAKNGLPDCYTSFDGFLPDFWSDFSWSPKQSMPEIKAVLADTRFKEIIPVLKETWGIDMEKELQNGLTEVQL